jgi:hypothetical protein
MLSDMGETQKATSILQGFLDAMVADPYAVNPNYIPENKEAQREGIKLLKNWENS